MSERLVGMREAFNEGYEKGHKEGYEECELAILKEFKILIGEMINKIERPKP